ncbi:hypothetical protein I316_07222 [Kwoniella heveanensis BCC8398]|uniref:Uncharacterized protein n=1 Tax=Kwoniella heveanensis BCC8398 TaxID=1296120 RepID=A0A1B9GJC0_9TREE|nr:hypothetical protein I316_07222 [Kwoniella heveanensis BCC8398]
MVTRLPLAESPPLATSSYLNLPTPKLNVVRNPSVRVRQAVRDNNVPLLSRLQHKTDLRNTDKHRLTSLSWAAIECSLEVFEWLLLDYGHDDQELSRDADNNTILHLLASVPSLSPSPYAHQLSSPDFPPRLNTLSLDEQSDISLRMTQVYHTLFPFLLDWSNSGGKTALHVAAQAGNHRFISLLCDLGADFDLTDLQGNTPLHYASAWGHLDSIRALLEKGCGFSSRNFEGFTPSDFAYSDRTLNALQVIARDLFEERRTRRKEESSSRSVAIPTNPSSLGPMMMANQSSGSIYEGGGPYLAQTQGYTQSQPPGRPQPQSLYQSSGGRGRSASLSASSIGGSSSVGGGAGGQDSYSSQPGRYMDDYHRERERHRAGAGTGGDGRSEKDKEPPLPPLPPNHYHHPYPPSVSGPSVSNGSGERTSSLPMSRYDSSASAAEGGTNPIHDSATNLSLPYASDQSQNRPSPAGSANISSSSSRSIPSSSIPTQGPGPAAPQAVLGRPTPPLQPGNLLPPPSSQRVTPTSIGGSSGRPTPPLPHRSPSMPTTGTGSSASLTRSTNSELPLPVPQANAPTPFDDSAISTGSGNPRGGVELPRMPDGMMMGSVMRRANSAQAQGQPLGRPI